MDTTTVVVAETPAETPPAPAAEVVVVPVPETPAAESLSVLELGQVMAKVDALEKQIPQLQSRAETAERTAQSAHERISSLEKPPQVESESVAVPPVASQEAEKPKAKRGGLRRLLLG